MVLGPEKEGCRHCSAEALVRRSPRLNLWHRSPTLSPAFAAESRVINKLRGGAGLPKRHRPPPSAGCRYPAPAASAAGPSQNAKHHDLAEDQRGPDAAFVGSDGVRSAACSCLGLTGRATLLDPTGLRLQTFHPARGAARRTGSGRRLKSGGWLLRCPACPTPPAARQRFPIRVRP